LKNLKLVMLWGWQHRTCTFYQDLL